MRYIFLDRPDLAKVQMIVSTMACSL